MGILGLTASKLVMTALATHGSGHDLSFPYILVSPRSCEAVVLSDERMS